MRGPVDKSINPMISIVRIGVNSFRGIFGKICPERRPRADEFAITLDSIDAYGATSSPPEAHIFL